MPYGVLEEGFAIKPESQILADVRARQEASSELGPSLDYETTGALGQLNNTIAPGLSELWELAGAVYKSRDPEGAVGVPLDELLSLTGAARRGAAPSTITGVLLTIEAGQTVPAGSLASVAGRPDIQFTLDADVENAGGVTADFEGDFTCTQDGPVAVNADTLTVIDTLGNGWTAVTNPNAANVGRFADSDIIYRQRWADQRARAGSTTVSAIRAMLLDSDTTPEFADIESVIVLENKGSTVDANGLPPKSVEAIIDDGETPTVDDDLIADRLFGVGVDDAAFVSGIAGGIGSHGNQSGTATDSAGTEHTIRFSRVTRKPVYIELTVTRGPRFPVDGAAKVAAALVDAGNALGIDADVIALFIRSQAFTVAGVIDVPEFAIGFAASPTEDDNLPVGYRERATFDTSNVSVTVAT